MYNITTIIVYNYNIFKYIYKLKNTYFRTQLYCIIYTSSMSHESVYETSFVIITICPIYIFLMMDKPFDSL